MPRLLIVEDDAVIGSDLADLATHWGWSVLGPARNSDEAFRLASAARPDVALVSIRLEDGKVSGVALAATLKSTMHIPIVYLSTLGDDRFAYTVRFTEPFALIRKPFDPEYLRRVLARAGRHSRPSPKRPPRDAGPDTAASA